MQHLVVRLAVHIQVLFEHDLPLGQSAGLVSTQHVHRAEILDGVQAFHDDLLARHGQCALGQVDGHDHGQHLGRQPDGHGHGEEECFQPVVPEESIDEKHRRNHDGDEPDHQPCELVDAQVKACQLALAHDLGGQGSKVRTTSGVDDHGG